MAEITTTNNSENKKTAGVKKLKRLTTKVDLTPMVDLGFLLVTFFVFTTTMAEARVMVMNEPNDVIDRNIKASGAMTILMGEQNQILYYFGELKDAKIEATTYEAIREIINRKRITTKQNDLMYIIKSDGLSTLKNTVDILDEMTICNVSPGHYAEVKITDEEKLAMQSVNN